VIEIKTLIEVAKEIDEKEVYKKVIIRIEKEIENEEEKRKIEIRRKGKGEKS